MEAVSLRVQAGPAGLNFCPKMFHPQTYPPWCMDDGGHRDQRGPSFHSLFTAEPSVSPHQIGSPHTIALVPDPTADGCYSRKP